MAQLNPEREAAATEYPFVFVAGLPKDVKNSEIDEVFGKCGSPKGVTVVRNEGICNSYAFLEFGSEEAILKALENNGKKFGKQQSVITVERGDPNRRKKGGRRTRKISGPIHRSKDQGASGHPY